MKFYDRKVELAALENACSGKSVEMMVVSGRRRIGKSRLLDEFLKNKDYATKSAKLDLNSEKLCVKQHQ